MDRHPAQAAPVVLVSANVTIRRNLITEVFHAAYDNNNKKKPKLVALGTCVLIAIFIIWSMLTSILMLPPPSHSRLSSSSPPAQGRIIVCHVTLRTCNAEPRAALASHVPICRVAMSLTSASFIVCTRREVWICSNTSDD